MDRIALVAIDLDQTLLTSDLSVSRADVNAIRRAAQSGLVLVLATGRMPKATMQIVGMLDSAFSHCISYNGAMTVDYSTNRVIDSVSVCFQQISGMHTALSSEYHRFVYFSGDLVFATSSDVASDPVLAYYEFRTGADIIGDVVLSDLSQLEIHKFLVYDSRIFDSYDPRTESVYEGEVHAIALQNAPVGISVLKTRLGYVECMSSDASKVRSLRMLIDQRSLSASQVMTIGDGYNDVDMIRWAGIGVAVSNAVQEALEAADIVVPSNDESGVAAALNLLAAGSFR